MAKPSPIPFKSSDWQIENQAALADDVTATPKLARLLSSVCCVIRWRRCASLIRYFGLRNKRALPGREGQDRSPIVHPGCPTCWKTFYTVSDIIDHINND